MTLAPALLSTVAEQLAADAALLAEFLTVVTQAGAALHVPFTEAVEAMQCLRAVDPTAGDDLNAWARSSALEDVLDTLRAAGVVARQTPTGGTFTRRSTPTPWPSRAPVPASPPDALTARFDELATLVLTHVREMTARLEALEARHG